MITKLVKDPKEVLFENKTDIIEKLNYFRIFSQKGLQNLTENQLSEVKSNFQNFFNLSLSFFADCYPTHLFRITINKNIPPGNYYKLQKISDIIGPPTEVAKLNRCNIDGESIFYAALDFKTAIWETQPSNGDWITVSEWQIKKGKTLNNQFIFDPFESNNSKESQEAYNKHLEEIKNVRPDHSEIFIELMRFYFEEFTKIVPNNAKLNYLFSSILSSRILFPKDNNSEHIIDSITYPSTKLDHKLSNMAIRNSIVLDRLELLAVRIMTVVETNYDTQNKDCEDLMSISPLITYAKEFDFVNDRIIYDLKRELKDAIELDQRKDVDKLEK